MKDLSGLLYGVRAWLYKRDYRGWIRFNQKPLQLFNGEAASDNDDSDNDLLYNQYMSRYWERWFNLGKVESEMKQKFPSLN